MSLFVEDEDQGPRPLASVQSQASITVPIQSGEIGVEFHQPEIVPVYPERTISCTLPLKYQQEIIEDMLTKDGLLILGRGLGWDVISANLLHALSSSCVTLQHGDGAPIEKRSLIFVLNITEDEVSRIRESLVELHWLDESMDDEEEPQFVEISSESHNTSSKRKDTYLKGGIISITARVLVVDLLSGLLSPNDITGLYVLHAERIKETSSDAFVISIYRDTNDWGFVKAISDEPESITGFTPLATTLKMLRVPNAFLWPRFRLEVSQCLNYIDKGILNRVREEILKRRSVTEINTKFTYKMTKIQSAILSCIQACLQELKRHNSDLATEYWDMENAHDPHFVRRIRMSVNSQWHRLTYTSRQLVYDLGVLTDMLNYLVSMDSVSFYQMVQGIVDLNIRHARSGGMNASMSPWLNLDDSNTIIAFSRDRALGKISVEKRRQEVIDVEDNQENPSETADVEVTEEYLLEELPKWEQLGLLLDDILHEKAVSNVKNQGPILIMCSNPHSVEQLGYLLKDMKAEVNRMTGKRRFSSRKYMVQKLKGYLAWKEVSSLVKKINTELDAAPEEGSKTPEADELHTSKTFTRNGQPVSSRRRARGASASARVSKLYSGSNSEKNTEAAEVDATILKNLQAAEDEEEIDDERVTAPNELEEMANSFLMPEFADNGEWGIHLKFDHVNKEDQIIIQSYNERNNDALLQEISPSYIVMYEPNLSFTRRVEIYQEINKDNPAKAYLMYYGTSVEEEKHLLGIKKEKESFSRLIREKASLSKHFETADDNYKFHLNKNRVLNTRIAGGANFRTENDELRVIVDVREFRSSLPNLLYRSGIKVIPCMITVGDYIVSPKICVERKSIPDLVSSFKSGRLYQQCEQMFRHYELPTLLIEFDENKSFSLEPFSESRFQKINPTNPIADQSIRQNIQSKIVLLLLSFPKLKIIWSSSPYETAQIFVQLKANQEEPDVGEALDKGVNRAVVTEDGGPPVFNDDPIDFIQNIPGINAANYHLIVQKVQSIEKLVELSKEQFLEILGLENGRKAYNFINKTIS
ncbi:uncharacterized protein CANTADRAFT_19997 [Suhomyces tanzawaensis NRRL Y-17324]|uniref:ERCC4 domain-containing protein n=1 Tax=Suhomyces tanzawaensis NRRL Y-17324 TaxID=984487 RepID=A0A1E4SSF6_9ASCO|nr:uncharacterized protein CANTADRAFT_19997 [Suhomyces tanzawaensis NRRL Y-17324]ODV82449.1 hypothetical protein CANTADRAFT_19997 [Suhomyces tanzawaensis NRRL Y-17324]